MARPSRARIAYCSTALLTFPTVSNTSFRPVSGPSRLPPPSNSSAERPFCVGVLSPISSMNPYDSLDFGCAMVQQQVYETLYHRHGTTVNPALASSMPTPVTGGRASYEITLRKGIKFSDGSPMTSEHVLASLKHVRRFSADARLEAREGSIIIDLERPDQSLATALSSPYSAITAMRTTTPSTNDLDTFLGTGPWRMAHDFTAESARLLPNPHHWGAAPKLNELRFVRFRVDANGRPQALVDALESGDVDLTTVLAAKDARRVQNARHLIRPGSSTALLWLNVERLRKLPLREAICCAIDRYGLAEKSYLQPEQFVASSVLPPGMHVHSDRYAFDKDRALARLAQSTTPDLPLRLLAIWGPRGYLPAPRNWAASIQEMLAAIGLPCEVVHSKDAQDYQEQIRRGDYDLLLGGWAADTEDPADFMEALYDPVVIPTPTDVVSTGCNFSRISDAILEANLLSYRQTRSAQALEDVLSRADKLMVVLPLAYGPTIAVHGWHVAGFRANPLGIPDFCALHLRG